MPREAQTKSTRPACRRAGLRWWALPFILAAALIGLLWAAGPAQAHGERFAKAEKIWPLLDDEQPEELDNVTVQLEHTGEGSWLVAENETDKTLDIYDAEGEPFLRLGPEGESIKYNRFAEEYYLTKALSQNPPKEVRENPEAGPEWVHLTDGPTVAWRDRRVEGAEDMSISEQVPMRVREAQQDTDVGEWSVPMRLGEAGNGEAENGEPDTRLRGTYRYEGPPKGDYAARMTSELEGSEVTVQLLHGVEGASDALSLRNRGEEPVKILDDSGEPAIQIGPEESRVNVNTPMGHSAAELQLGSGSVGEPREAERPEWKTVSGGPGFLWLDPRLQPLEGQTQPGDPENAQDVSRWEIPMEVAGQEKRLSGVIEWEPSEWEPPEQEEQESSTSREVATVAAVTVLPAATILAILVGPGLYKRRRHDR